jgi:hypothetical protein
VIDDVAALPKAAYHESRRVSVIFNEQNFHLPSTRDITPLASWKSTFPAWAWAEIYKIVSSA